MAALEIPGVGEALGRHIREFSFGASGESPDVTIGSGTGTTALVNIQEPNVFIEDLETQVVIAVCTASTGAVSMTIGDSDDVDGYWTDTLLNVAATSGDFANMTTTVAYAQGHLVTSTLSINLIKGSALASAGKVKCRITYWRGVDTDLNPATSS